VIALRFSPKVKSNIPLDEVMKLFVRHNLSFTKKKKKEKKHGNKKIFNVANLIEPGIFVENEDIPGFTFFFQQTDPKTDLIILNQMFETMQKLCKNYDAWILDDNGKNINRSDLNKLLAFNA
jgi:FtsZ-interacting cell division protein ZipA